MRYDRTVIFCKKPDPRDREYNVETGDYVPAQAVETERTASVMDTDADTLRLVYGEIRQGSYIVQLQTHYTEPFDYIMIDGIKYSVDRRRHLRHKDTFVVSQVQ